MVDFTIAEEIRSIGDNLIRFIESEVLPLEAANRELLENERNLYDESGRFVPKVQDLRKQVRMASAEAGFYTMFAPDELGGGGLGRVAQVYAFDLVAARYGPDRPLIHPVVLPSPFTNGLSPLLTWLAPELRERVLPGIASGEKTLCFAISEPDAGSDIFSIKSRAERDGDEWIINGSKQWITNSPYADYCMVFVVTDPERAEARKGGLTGFFVETERAGFEVTSVLPVMGHLGGDTGIVALDNLRVPDSHRLGEVDAGHRVAMTGINTGRLGIAATCCGLAKWALDQALDYANTRKTFGRTIGQHQAVQLLLADSAMDIYASRNTILNCAWRADEGLPVRKEVAMVKAFATEALNRVMDRAIQVHGGMGLTRELRLEAGYRFARTMRIPDGTGEIQRRTVAKEMLAGDREL